MKIPNTQINNNHNRKKSRIIIDKIRKKKIFNFFFTFRRRLPEIEISNKPSDNNHRENLKQVFLSKMFLNRQLI